MKIKMTYEINTVTKMRKLKKNICNQKEELKGLLAANKRNLPIRKKVKEKRNSDIKMTICSFRRALKAEKESVTRGGLQNIIVLYIQMCKKGFHFIVIPNSCFSCLLSVVITSNNYIVSVFHLF